MQSTKYFILIVLFLFSTSAFTQVNKPNLQIQRGGWHIDNYYVSKWPRGAKVWCDIWYKNNRIEILNQQSFYSCSLAPGSDPHAVTLILYDGDKTGLYLLRLEQDKPVFEKINNKPHFGGRWSSDGLVYVINQKAYFVQSGQSKTLPKYQGEFFSFSPDKEYFLSLIYSLKELQFHLVQSKTGKTKIIKLKRDQNFWVLDRTHTVKGCVECNHIWSAQKIKWQKTTVGWSVNWE